MQSERLGSVSTDLPIPVPNISVSSHKSAQYYTHAWAVPSRTNKYASPQYGRHMQPFNFKVVRSDDKDSQVPVSVAGQTMVDVQQLLTDIGALMIRRELRLQNDMPEDLMRRFCLSMDLSKGRDVGAVTEGEDTLMLDALNQLFRELDLANMPEARDAPSNHLEALSRRNVSKDLLALSEHLEGYDLFYGSEVAYACPAYQCIVDVFFERIGFVHDRSDTSLCVIGVAFAQIAFGDDHDVSVFGGFQCEAQPGDAAADD